jgi:hypothetical protein
MAQQTWWETFSVQGGELLDTVRRLVHEGNVRRIVIRQGERTVAEFPLTAGVVGAVIAPVLAAVGALAALLTQCTIAVERSDETRRRPGPRGTGQRDGRAHRFTARVVTSGPRTGCVPAGRPATAIICLHEEPPCSSDRSSIPSWRSTRISSGVRARARPW